MPAMPETTSPKKTAFFDFDGTLVAPVFGAGAKKRYIAAQKLDWIFPEIVPVANGRDKVSYILAYAADNGLSPSDCVLVDDDYPVVVQAAAAGISALHLSHVVAENYDPSGTDPRLHEIK